MTTQQPQTQINLPHSDVANLVQARRYSDALKLIIKYSLDIGRKHPQRAEVAEIVLKLVNIVKSSEIEAIVNTLDLDEIDVLMRFIYYGFEHNGASSAHLLTWHDRVCNRGGVGSIVRVLTEH